MSVLASEGFTYLESSDRVAVDGSNEEFFATNRSWKEVNHSFDKLPALCIKEMVRSSDYGLPLRVLDVGAGLERRASEELQESKRIGEYLAVTGLDAVMKSGDTYGAKQVLGNFLDAPLDGASYDFIYSRQGIAVAAMSKPVILGTALTEVSRLMSTDAIAFVDIDPGQSEFAVGFEASKKEIDASLFLGRLGTFDKLKDLLTGYGYYRRQDRPRFLILANGIGTSLVKSLAAKGKDIEAI